MKTQLAIKFHDAIRSAGKYDKPVVEDRYHKHDEYLTYGLDSGDFKIFEGFRDEILSTPLNIRLDAAKELLELHIGEPGHAGIYILSLSTKEMDKKSLSIIDKITGHFKSS